MSRELSHSPSCLLMVRPIRQVILKRRFTKKVQSPLAHAVCFRSRSFLGLEKLRAQELNESEVWFRIAVVKSEPNELQPGALVLSNAMIVQKADPIDYFPFTHLPNTPRTADRVRLVSAGSVCPEASRIPSSQATSFRLTMVPKISSIAI